MLLKKKEVLNNKTEINLNYEKVADDLLMISITNKIGQHGIPSYWRLTQMMEIPPLEIGIDCQYGMISSITFFVDRLVYSEIEEVTKHILEGNIIIYTDRFTKENEYFDVKQSYTTYICNSRLVCSFGDLNDKCNAYKNDRLEVYTDLQGNIVGFAICNLSKEEMDVIKSIKIN